MPIESKVGLLVSGTMTPARNSFIEHFALALAGRGAELVLIYNGFKGFVECDFAKVRQGELEGVGLRPGCVAGSGAYPAFAEFVEDKSAVSRVFNTLRVKNLVVLGGEGTLQGAQRLARHGCNIVFIPTTAYGDLAFSEYCLGEDSMLGKAGEMIQGMLHMVQPRDHVQLVLVPCAKFARQLAYAYGVQVLEGEDNLSQAYREIRGYHHAHWPRLRMVVAGTENLRTVKYLFVQFPEIDWRSADLLPMLFTANTSFRDAVFARQLAEMSAQISTGDDGSFALACKDEKWRALDLFSLK